MITPLDVPDILPYKPVVMDIETAPDGSLLDIGVLYDDTYAVVSTWKDFTSIIVALHDVSTSKHDRRKNTVIYAHNGGRFDWLHYIRHLLDNSELSDCQVMMSEQIIIAITITLKTGHKFTLADSLRLMPYALKDIAEKMNETHKKIYIGEYITRMDLFKDRERDNYYHYLHEDCYALQEAILSFWKKIHTLEGSIGYLPLTLPALALRVFRQYIQGPIFTPTNQDVKDFTRRAYTGGRVECYRPGLYKHVNVFDVNSMYPFIMATYPVPVSNRGYWVDRIEPGTCGFYEVEYVQYDQTIPPLLRDEKTHEFTYTGSGVFYIGELLTLPSEAISYKVSKGYIFQDTEVLFKSFVDRYYGIRLQAKSDNDPALDFIAKIMLNSLYGKFGQRPIRLTLELANNAKLEQYVRQGKTVTVRDEFMLVESEAQIDHEFTAIAAIITAMARSTLYCHIRNAGDSYIYADTDSVHCDGTTLETGDGLGALKLEKSGEAVYIGRKLYGLRSGIGEYIKAKGVGRAIKSGVLNYANLAALGSGEIDQLVLQFESTASPHEVLSRKAEPATFTQRTRTLRRP